MHGQLFLADGKDLIHNCQIAKCKAIIVDSGQAKGAMAILERIQYIEEKTGHIRYAGLPDPTTTISFRVCSQTDDVATCKRSLQCLEEDQEMFEEPNITDYEDAVIFCTSGTTGFSKQVLCTHRTCLHLGCVFGQEMGIKSEHSRYIADRSLGWLGGYPGPYLVYGATRVLTDHAEGFPQKSDRRILRLIDDEGIDCGFLLPGDIDLLVKGIDSGYEIKRRLRSVCTGGMPITKRVLKAIGKITDAMNIVYGSTEVGFVSSLHLEEGTPFEDNHVGAFAVGVKLKVIDKAHNEVPIGTVCELAIQSETMSAGYLNEPDKTRKAFTKGKGNLTIFTEVKV